MAETVISNSVSYLIIGGLIKVTVIKVTFLLTLTPTYILGFFKKNIFDLFDNSNFLPSEE